MPPTLLALADEVIDNLLSLLHLLRSEIGTSPTQSHARECPQLAEADIHLSSPADALTVAEPSELTSGKQDAASCCPAP